MRSEGSLGKDDERGGRHEIEESKGMRLNVEAAKKGRAR